MKLSLTWLKDYIDFDLSVDELAHKLTMIGLEVEEVVDQTPSFSQVVVGRVLSVEKHPNADKLHVCQVDVGKEPLNIVCGAPNVQEGQLVPVATIGAELTGGFKIKKAKLRGIESFGMICSERELGLSESHEGILVLNDTDVKVGDEFNPAGSNPDVMLEVNVTPNRPDCLSIIGIARELSAITGNPVKIPAISLEEETTSADELIELAIEDVDACPRYSARVVRHVKIGPSPDWMKSRLETVGIRSINNVVDVTNFVLMETGHPLHAFDYDEIADHKIIVRKAVPGEPFCTLDDKEHKLQESDLLICDGKRPVALAGVMGGQNSEVSETTQHILLESAYFHPLTVRKTAKRLGYSTEASQRFERGADPNNTLFAVNRAAQLLNQLADGQIAKDVVDLNPKPVNPWTVELRLSRIERVLGVSVSMETVTPILESLGMDVTGDEILLVTVPTFRPDLTREIDLIEEVVRHLGYDKIDPAMHSTISLELSHNSLDRLSEKLKDFMIGQGFYETLTNSLVSEKHNQPIKGVHPVTVKNPLSPETAQLRASLVPSLLDVIQWNVNRSSTNLKIFEIGRVFHATAPQKLPVEPVMLVALISGNHRPQTWWGEPDKSSDLYHIKGYVESLLHHFHATDALIQPSEHALFNHDSSFSICISDNIIGHWGEIKPELLNVWDISQQVFAFEVDIEKLQSILKYDYLYSPISIYPTVRRDLAVIVDEKVLAGDLKQIIEKQGSKLLDSVQAFDLYRGKQIQDGKKSVAFSMTFVSSERTLTDDDIDPIVRRIVQTMEKQHHASLRSI